MKIRKDEKTMIKIAPSMLAGDFSQMGEQAAMIEKPARTGSISM